MAKKATKPRGFIKYNTYSFVDKSPMIDVFRTARSDADMSYKEVEEASGVKSGTMHNWEHGKVRRPFEATIFAALAALPNFKGIGWRNGKPYLLK